MKKKIMIVTDDTSTSSYDRTILNRLNPKYKFIYADIKLKCSWLNDNKLIPDVILIDSQMSDDDGICIFIDLKINPLMKDIPVIFLVDEYNELKKNFIRDILDTSYFLKPFKIKDLKKRIDNVLKKKPDES